MELEEWMAKRVDGYKVLRIAMEMPAPFGFCTENAEIMWGIAPEK